MTSPSAPPRPSRRWWQVALAGLRQLGRLGGRPDGSVSINYGN